MPDILKSDEGVTQRFVDMNDSTFAKKFATSLVASSGLEAGVSAYGYLRVTDEPTTVMNETFDTLDTVNNWTLKNSTGTTTVANSILTVASSTTANAYGGLFTKPTFSNNGVNFLVFGAAVRMNTSVIANTYRFWGMGTVPASPTTASPISEGYGFELSASGVYSAVVYRANTKVFSSPIPDTLRPVDGSFARFVIVQRADLIAFYVTSLTTPAAVASFPNLAVGTLPAVFLSVAGGIPPASSATMDVTGFGMADTGKNAQMLMDRLKPWVRSTLKDTTEEASSAETALVVRERLAVDAFQYTGILTTNTPVAVNAAGAAGIRNYCQTISYQNTGVTATTVLLQDGATTIAQWNAPASMVLPFIHKFDPPIRTTAATALNINCGTTGANVLVNAGGFRAA